MDALTRLAHSARAGDQAALESFIHAGYEPVWRLCATLVDQQSGDDLAQETFLRALRALPGFRGDSSARTWLLAIARHTCLDELRSRTRRRRRDAFLVARAVSDEPIVADASQDIAIVDLLARLEPARRARSCSPRHSVSLTTKLPRSASAPPGPSAPG